jgi:phage-related protein (TIGR01555 family)
MAWFAADSLRTAISAINPFGRQQSVADRLFTPQLAIGFYLSSGMMRKVIDIPAADRVREWRDWQAESDAITALEAEEKRLGLVAKFKHAEVLRGLGGGALILALPGALNTPAPRVSAKGLAAVNVASRWQLQLVDIDENMASLTYGQPRMFRINAGSTGQQDIHPSRVICFRGDPLPIAAGINSDDAFWGASRLERVLAEVQKSDNASQWFAELVKKAKLLRIGIPDLADMVATPGGQQKLEARVSTIALGESTLNATVYAAGSGVDGAGGEKISDYQITWAGIPAMMDAFDQRVAAVADIPFTRLMGRSPAGMNATGQSDTDNWNKMVVAGQNVELRPCLEALDAYLVPSAGVTKPVTWRFAPLSTPSEKEEADTFKTFMEAIEKVQGTNAIPERPFNEAFQNWMEEREYMPGLAGALAKVPEAERFGLAPDDDGTDPSEITQQREEVIGSTRRGGEDDGSVAPARRAANDKVPEGEA